MTQIGEFIPSAGQLRLANDLSAAGYEVTLVETVQEARALVRGQSESLIAADRAYRESLANKPLD